MARIRTIKPDFWTDEKVGNLKRDERLLFIGLWNIADDQGVVKANPAYIRGQLFSYDEDLRSSTVKTWLTSLINARMIIPFSFNGESYFVIRTFDEHQLINRPSKAKFPQDTIGALLEEHSLNTHGVITEGSQQEGKGREIDKEKEIDARERAGSETEKNNDDLFKGKTSEGPPPGSAPPPPKYPFEKFWDLYDKKRGKAKTEKKWNRLSDKQKSEAMRALPAYVQSTPDVNYRKDPLTWLNGEHWNDEILKPKTNEGVKKGGSGFGPKNGGFNILAEQLKQQIADGARPDGS